MYAQYHYAAPLQPKIQWHFGWNSCLLFIANLMILTLYVLIPGISLRVILAGSTLIGTLGAASATYSLIFSKFWLSKTYATCGLLGNICVVLWLLMCF